jgi:hypothetical protein
MPIRVNKTEEPLQLKIGNEMMSSQWLILNRK